MECSSIHSAAPALALLLLVGGCQPSLGECDEAAAFGPIYYDANGSPAYPGQALMEVSCAGGSFCHTSGIAPGDRLGAPEGLDLDVYASDGTAEDLERLRYARRVAWNLRHHLYAEVVEGHMPPSAPRGARDSLTPEQLDLLTAVSTHSSYRADGAPLPDVRDPAGREVLRNWLACGAHVVEATEGTSEGVGDIVPAGAVSSCAGVDTQTDPMNCGSCGIVCGAGQTCAAGACACANAELSACGSRCVDLLTDNMACGACDNDCGARFCAAGSCVSECPGGTTDCGGSCVDLAASAAHCGGCGNACGASELCAGGTCSCAGGTTECGGACVDTSTDAANCGGCGNACASAESCAGGACTCGLTACGAECVDTQTSLDHCGACGSGCDGSCIGGACIACGTAASFAGTIAPFLENTCAGRGCHSGARPAADLTLLADRAYGELVGVPASCGSLPLVQPGDVAGSYVWAKLTGVGICSGNQMPKTGEPLSQAELEMIQAWICNGARND